MCCKGFLKIMMFIFNGGIFLAGVAILGVGIWVTVDSDSLLGLFDRVENLPTVMYQLAYVGYLLIGVGSGLLIIGFLGCCGAIRENRCMLLTFFSIVLIIFLAEIAGAILLFVFQDVVDETFDSIADDVRKTIRKDYGEDEGFTSLWNTTMEEFHCCGYKNYTDFEGSPFNNAGGNIFPKTCCRLELGQCNENAAHLSDITGCFDNLINFLEKNSGIVAGVAIGIAALEIAAMVVSMVLYCNAGKKS